MKTGKLISLLVLGSAMALPAADIELGFQRVALSSQPAPGFTNNVRFSVFHYVSLADDGRIAFTADLSGPGVTSSNNLGLWAGIPGDVRLLVLTGDPVPNDTNEATFVHLALPNIDNHQAMSFLAKTSDGSEFKACRDYLVDLKKKYEAQAEADRRVGIAKVIAEHFGPPIRSCYNFNHGYVVNAVAGRAELSGPGIGATNFQAIMAGRPTNVMVVAQQGSPAPGVSGNFTAFPLSSQTLALMPDGTVAFRATVSDPPATRDGLWFGKAGTLEAVMIGGKGAAPESLLGPGYTFGFGPSSENVEVNAKGELAFATPLSGPGLSDTNSDFVVAGKPGNLRVIAQSGQPAPGIPGALFGPFAAFSHVLLGTDGTTAFIARYSTNGTDSSSGLWLAPPNGAPPILLMHAGQRAPGTPADVYFQSSLADEAYFMNSRNQVVFRSLLAGPGLNQFDKGIWLAEPNGTVSLIVRRGDLVDVGGGVLKQVDSVTFGVDPETIACPEDGRRSPFNDRGEVALLVYFTDFSSGLFLAQTGLNLSAEKAGADLHLKFPTLAGKHYRVDFKTNLTDASWSVLAASVDGTGAHVTVTNSGTTVSANSRFYRAVRTD